MGSRAIIYIGAVVLLVGGALAWLIVRPQPSATAPALTPEAKAYVHNLQLSDVSLKATESYVKQMVTEIEGNITNHGDRGVQEVDVFCVFYNAYGEVILRERVPIVTGGLKPGQTKAFRLPFDNLPGGWNNQMPQLVIAHIEFG